MREAPPRIQRQDRIAAYRAEADRLLRLVQHPSMKTQISFAVRDLQEAAISVHHRDFNDVFVLQQIATALSRTPYVALRCWMQLCGGTVDQSECREVRTAVPPFLGTSKRYRLNDTPRTKTWPSRPGFSWAV